MEDIKRISFRNILNTTQDIQEKVLEWRNLDSIKSMMLNQNSISREEHKNWLNKLPENNRIIFWVIFFNEIPIGTINLQDIDLENKSSGWGFYIGDKNYLGKGLSKLIMQKFLKQFFEEMDFSLLVTKVLEKNKIAFTLYKKIGFKAVGEETIKVNNDKIKMFVLNYTKNDWKLRNHE
jgi:UDP-4-amino-4,6-dideoxy-N-acetyl-beta-L-altrosamine N-acetyltransferase